MSIAEEFHYRFSQARQFFPGTLQDVEIALESEQSNYRDEFGPWPNMNRDDEYDYVLNKVADRFGIDPDEL